MTADKRRQRPRVAWIWTALLTVLLGGTSGSGAAPQPEEAEVVISVRPSVLPRERLALPDPIAISASPELARSRDEIREVLWDDLRYSGVFDLVPRELYARVPPTTPEQVPYEEWVAVGASWVALVQLSSLGGEIVFEGRLFETKVTRKLVLGKRYQGAPEVARRIAHTFADAVIQQVSGEPGVCTTQIAFVSNRDNGRDRQIYQMDYDGHAPRRLTGTRGLNMSPEWSPRNDQIAYTSFLRGNPDLYIMPRAGGANRVLFARRGLNISPAWSPDGATIAFASSFDSQDSEIYTITPEGTGLTRLTRSSGIDTNPAWAPGGRQIAFTSDRGGRPQIWLMDADGLNPRQLTRQGGFNDGAAWAPRGRSARLAFAGMSAGTFQIFVYVFDTDTVIQLTSEGSNEAPSWSPDGRQIAFASTRGGKSDIWVMNDDGSNLRRITSGGNNLSPAWSHR